MCRPHILQRGKLKPKATMQCVWTADGELLAESMPVPFSPTSVTSHSMEGFPRNGEVPHFFPCLAKSNQSSRSIHWVSTEASPFINVIPWETISSTDKGKNKYFC